MTLDAGIGGRPTRLCDKSRPRVCDPLFPLEDPDEDRLIRLQASHCCSINLTPWEKYSFEIFIFNR